MSLDNKRQAVINSIFDDYENKDSGMETTEQKIIEVENAVYQALLVKYDAVNASEKIKRRIHSEMKVLMATMNTTHPALVHPEKILRSIGASDYNKAGKYLEDLDAYRKKKIRISQSSKAKSPRKGDPLTKILDEIVKQNPEITNQEVMDKLEQINKRGVIVDIQDGEIIYERENRPLGVANVANIPSRISKLRKKYKK
jgi:hypothetical protein